jgi:protein TonB
MGAAMHGSFDYSNDDRVFYYAIAASVVFHAFVLFALPGIREGRHAEPPGVFVARIVEPLSAPVQPREVAPPVEPPKPRVEPLKPRVERPKPAPVRKPSPLTEPEPPPRPSPQPSAAEPPPASAAPAEIAPPAIARAEAAPGPAGAPDDGSLKDYESRLSFFAARYKAYPRVAQDNAWEGNVEVMMVVGANGVLRSISVKTSSGHEVLDRQAIEMFRRAKPLVPIPPALAGKEFTVVRWVSFGLKEGG